jgi:hypothetical protein
MSDDESRDPDGISSQPPPRRRRDVLRSAFRDVSSVLIGKNPRDAERVTSPAPLVSPEDDAPPQSRYARPGYSDLTRREIESLDPELRVMGVRKTYRRDTENDELGQKGRWRERERRGRGRHGRDESDPQLRARRRETEPHDRTRPRNFLGTGAIRRRQLRRKHQSQSASPKRRDDGALTSPRGTRPPTSEADSDPGRLEAAWRPRGLRTKPFDGDANHVAEEEPTRAGEYYKKTSKTTSQRDQSEYRRGDYRLNRHRMSLQYPVRLSSRLFGNRNRPQDEIAGRKANREARQPPSSGYTDIPDATQDGSYGAALQSALPMGNLGLSHSQNGVLGLRMETENLTLASQTDNLDPLKQGSNFAWRNGKRTLFSSNEDADAQRLNRGNLSGQVPRTMDDGSRAASEASTDELDSIQEQSPGVRQKSNHGASTAAKKTPPKSKREQELQMTLEAILDAVEYKSMSLNANEVLIQLEKSTIATADRAVDSLLTFYDRRYGEAEVQHQNKILAAVSEEKKRCENEYRAQWLHSERENQKDKDLLEAKNLGLKMDLESAEEQNRMLDLEVQNKTLNIQQMHGQRILDVERIKLLESEIARHKRDLADKTRELEATHRVELDKAKREYDAMIDSQKKQYENELRTQAEQYEEEKQGLIADAAKAQADAADQKSKLWADFEADKAKTKDEFDNEIYRLDRELNHYKQVVGDRDRNQLLADGDIISLFQKLTIDVGQFASKIQWNPKLEDKWPYGERALQYSKNDRLVQKLILQQRTWEILDKFIFCTPFQVLAQTGSDIQATWTTTFGETRSNSLAARLLTIRKGYHAKMPSEWPKPTQRSEQWRYVTIREWLEIIEQPGSQSRAKQTGKDDYESTLKFAIADMLDMVGRVSYSGKDSKTVNEVTDIVKRAAISWLKMGSQRCRIIISLPNVGEVAADGAGEEYLPRELVAHPELRRIGNFLGQHLDTIDDVVVEAMVTRTI